MSAKITNFTNKAGETTGIVSFDESAHSWRIASKTEPSFQRTFPSAQAAWFMPSGMFGAKCSRDHLLTTPEASHPTNPGTLLEPSRSQCLR